MFHNNSAITLAGGLTLMLVSSSCASQSIHGRRPIHLHKTMSLHPTAMIEPGMTELHMIRRREPWRPARFRTDAKGNVIYMTTRPVQVATVSHKARLFTQDATAHVRDARIKSQAAGMRQLRPGQPHDQSETNRQGVAHIIRQLLEQRPDASPA
jgi:hypothetical protein